MIMVCEGENDTYFIGSILKSLGIEYIITEELRRLYSKLREISRKTDDVIIFQANGKKNVYKAINRIVLELKHQKNFPKVAVVLDKNHGDVYNEIFEKIDAFAKTPCKFHPKNTAPKIIKKSNRIEVQYKKGNRILKIYVHEIEKSLESNIKNFLKEEYHEYFEFDPHDFINAVVNNHFNGDKRKFFEEVLNSMEKEPWVVEFKNFIKKLLRDKNED